MNRTDLARSETDLHDREALFETLSRNLTNRGYSVHRNALPRGLSQQLSDQQKSLPPVAFLQAGVGRGRDAHTNPLIRTDRTSWIDGKSQAGADWNAWAAALQAYLNARLFLGLFSFESHYSHYAKGDYYRKHQDAFFGQGNRILSVVTYFNRDWVQTDAGELVLFTGDEGGTPIAVAPQFGTLVAFLSEEIPHEVLMTTRDRYSIAGWFRLNGMNGTGP